MRIFRSFQAKLLVSFLAIAFILALWLVFDHSIDAKVKKLDRLASAITALQTDYLLKSRFLQHFLLTGYHQSSFYIHPQQNEIDSFENDLQDDRRKIELLAPAIDKNQPLLQSALNRLANENAELSQQIKELKVIYRKKGFKDYGLEGEMRTYAHQIEDSAMIPKIEILQLRRHEKDFLLRGSPEYAKEFFELADQLIRQYNTRPRIRKALLHYEESFRLLAGYYDQIGLYSSSGLYNQIQQQSEKIVQSYLAINSQINRSTRLSKHLFRQIFILGSFAFLLLLIFATWRLAQYLTREIRELNQIILAYIHSGFKASKKQQAFFPKILEVQTINSSFQLLKKKLEVMINERNDHQKLLLSAVVEGQEKERRFIGAELHDNINPMLATVRLYLTTKAADEQQQQQMLKEASAILDKSIQEIRKLSHSLVGANLNKISLQDSLNDLFIAVEIGARFDIRFYCQSFDETRLSEEQKLALYRIAQEQLANIVKYANPKKVAILLEEKDNMVKLIIKDDGIGFDSSQKQKGIGLRNIETRLEILNGHMFLHTSPNRGCELVALLPVEEKKIAHLVS